jgi:peptide/nickel transport system substrate-binding protein
MRAMGQEILPKHRYASYVKAGTFSHAMGLDTKTSDVVGTGPFVLASYRPGERVVLTRNPRYWKKDAGGNALPYLDRVVYTVIPSPETAMLRFLEGSIDLYGIKPDELAYLAQRKTAKHFEIYNGGLTFGSQFVAFNMNTKTVDAQKRAVFEDRRFRQAVAYAIDRKQITDIVLNGLGEAQYGPESPASKVFFCADVARYPYDPAKAAALLDAIGVNDLNADGMRELPGGAPLRITLMTDAKSPERVLIASMIRKDLSALGITVDLQALSFNHLVTKLTATFDWEMVLIGLTGGSEPHFGRNVWHSSGGLHLWDPKQPSPARPWEARIDEIFDEAVRLTDDAERRKLYDEWQKIAAEELPLIYTVLPYSLYAVRERFGNFFPTANGGAFWNIEYVYVKQAGGA